MYVSGTESNSAALESKPWDPIELILASANDYGPFKPCSLQATDKFPLHAFFARECWSSVSDQHYDILRPSMQFASNSIHAGMHYLCSFVPSSRVHDFLTDERVSVTGSYQIDPRPWSEQDVLETRKELDDIAHCVEWEVNDTIAKDNKWLGITRLVTSEKWGPRPWRDLSREDIINSDAELIDQGAFRRYLKVGIMQEYVDALNKYSVDSEEHLRAAFLAGITMVHEVGHIVWHQDFRSMDYDKDGAEPYFADYSISELGCCFIASIFDGKNPFECGKRVPTDFTQALYWERVPKTDTEELYRTDYSMSILYLEKLLSQESWNTLDPSDPRFLIEVRDMLRPEHDMSEEVILRASSLGKTFGFGIKPASANTREWTVSQYDGLEKVIWKSSFVDRRIRSDEKLKNVTYAEKKLAKYEINMANPRVFHDIHLLSSPSHTNPLGIHNDLDDPRLIDDGVINLDLVDSGWIVDLTVPKRIEVLYRTKSADFRDIPQARPHHHRRRTNFTQVSKISKLDWFSNLDTGVCDTHLSKDFQFGGPEEEYEPANVLDLIANKQPDIIARTTIKDAHQFCIERYINFDRPLPATYIEQNQKLDRSKKEDRFIIERIRHFCLTESETLFEGDNQALLYLYYAQLKYLNDWSVEDLKEKCTSEELGGSDGDVGDLRQRVRDHLVKYIVTFAQMHNLSANEEAFIAVGLVDDVDPLVWTDLDFIDFFHINNLPTWGNRRIWTERHAAFEREQDYITKDRSHKIKFDSKGAVQRSVNGVESYAWDAILEGSSVQSLKWALFEAGHFPSDSTLNLYFGNNRGMPLEDEKPLSFYELADWKTLTLEITRSSHTNQPGISSANNEPPVVFYKPKISGFHLTVGDNIHIPSLLGVTDDPAKLHSNTSVVGLPKRPGVHKDVRRIYDLTHHKSQFTVTELIDSIHTRAQELTQIQHPLGARDILRPHLKTVRSKSVLEMLDSFHDLEDVREERQRIIDMQVDPEEVSEEDERKMPRSFMRDIYSELKGRV